jgi:hypothetical protein
MEINIPKAMNMATGSIPIETVVSKIKSILS